MREIREELKAKLARTVTAPGYLIDIGFETPVRLSNRGTIDWDGKLWNASNISIAGINFDSAPNQKCTIKLADVDSSMTALLLNNDIADRPVVIYQYDGDVQDSAMMMIFGVGAEASGDAKNNVTISVENMSSRTVYLPRIRISKEFGFSIVPPNGTVLSFPTVTFTITQRY